MVATPHSRIIPLAIPAGFIFLGEAFLLASAVLLALHPEAFLIPRHPLGLAGAHLYLLGYGVGVLLGALHQLLPVVLEAPLHRSGLGYPGMALWALGVALLVLGFLQAPTLVPIGGGITLLALLLFAYHAYRTFRRAPRWNRVATALAWVVFYLLLTPFVGLFQALSLRFGLYDPERLAWHLLAGLGGIFLLSILGVGYKLVSMFTLTHGVDEGVLGLLLWTANLGLWGLALGERLGYGLLLLAYGLALYDTYRILRRRAKRRLDIGVHHYLVGLFFLGLALACLPLRPIWAALWFALGFVGLVVSGMLYKILPFLVWTHRYASKAGKVPVPLLREMLPERLGYLAGGLWAVGALLFPFLPQAAWGVAVGAVVHAYALWEVMRR
ncbi:hypothetical protein TJA_04210 [Thermus sp. LT1-2-5]|uniref:hypothetical protein n=1 Tax=Thermus sp. LT1-2-5 TaxID=3026935 RepID=UPI0030E954AC